MNILNTFINPKEASAVQLVRHHDEHYSIYVTLASGTTITLKATNYHDAARIYSEQEAKLLTALGDSLDDVTRHKWISTKDILPQNGVQVIVYGKITENDQDEFIGTDHCIDRRVKQGAWSEYAHVKYWMHFSALPAPDIFDDEE